MVFVGEYALLTNLDDGSPTLRTDACRLVFRKKVEEVNESPIFDFLELGFGYRWGSKGVMIWRGVIIIIIVHTWLSGCLSLLLLMLGSVVLLKSRVV